MNEFFSNNRVDLAAAYAIPLLLITMAMLGVQRWLLARKGYTVVGGKGGERRIVQLGRWRWVMFAYAMLVAALSVFMPLLVLIQAAFSKAWGRGFALDNLTFKHVHFILFEHQSAMPSLVRSIVYAAIAAFAALALALVIAYVVKRSLLRFGSVLAFLCMAPFVIPGIILAIGFYAAYAPPPLLLAGTALIIIVAFTTRLLPIAYQNSAAGIASIHVEMEEAVRILGGGRLTAIRRVVAPLLKRSPGRGLDPDLRAGLPGAFDRDLPFRPEQPRALGADLRLLRGGPLRAVGRARRAAADHHRHHRRHRLPHRRARFHAAEALGACPSSISRA